jgi:hypothetical protein
MLDTTVNDQVTQFLDAFGAALEAGDIARVTDSRPTWRAAMA